MEALYSFPELIAAANIGSAAPKTPLDPMAWARYALENPYFVPLSMPLSLPTMGMAYPLFNPYIPATSSALPLLPTLSTLPRPTLSEAESLLVADALTALSSPPSSPQQTPTASPARSPATPSTPQLPSFSSIFPQSRSTSATESTPAKDDSDVVFDSEVDLELMEIDEDSRVAKSDAEPATSSETEATPPIARHTSTSDKESVAEDLSNEVLRIVTENLKSKRPHAGVGIFRCRDCARRFDTEADLSSHKVVHDKGKHFACPHCAYKSKTNNALEKHLLTHSVAKLYNCETCSYGTNYKDHYEGHLREHSGIKAFACDECDFKCNRKSHMNRHKLTHNPKKPFNCTLCGYSANRKEHLETHMYKHSGVKPFQCPQCPFACSDQHYMNRHMRTNH